MIISILSGRFRLNINDFIYFFPQLLDYFKTGEYATPSFTIIFGIRLPRIILAISIGAALSIAGLIFQQIFKNPIASPDILGVSSGASFGAALAMILAFNIPHSIQLFSFIFGLLAVLIAYMIKKISKNDNILYLVLSGIIVSAFFSSLLSAVKYLADPYQQLPSIVFWTMGGLYKANWSNTLFCLLLVLLLGYIFQKLSYKISILSMDEDLAKTMGINVSRLRNSILILTSFMVAICVSISGVIGWVALIIPHISRLIFKNDKGLTIYTGLIGAISLVLIDTVARSLTPSEIPIGILTSLIGAPILGYLIIVKKTI
ncbi:iron ABC transporter permease [Mycoplasmatota bacterium]|nr:iron ABC transporter permease [Mycoplasmatota bacterium]